MSYFDQMVAGIVATLMMTVFTEIVFRLLKRKYHVIRILANMIRFQRVTPLQDTPQPHMLIAGVMHFLIGVFFALMFRSFVTWVPDWSPSLQAMVFGIFIGLIAIGGWRLFFDLHPGPPSVSLPEYLGVIGLGHLVLSFTLAGIHQNIQS
jgi:hypothetical membrane protein